MSASRVTTATTAPSFDPSLWLGAFTAIGGGYVIGSDKRPFLLVDHCDGEQLTGVMAQIVGHPDRVEAVRDAIEQRWA